MNSGNLIDVFTNLKVLTNNIKKSVNNINTKETLGKQLKLLNELYTVIQQKIDDDIDVFVDKDINNIIKVSRQLYCEATTIIKNKLQNFDKMSQEGFDLKTAIALIQPYDGSPGTLDAFVDSVVLLAELTTAANTAVAVKFVKTRLSGKARAALPANANTLDQIIAAVKQHCTSTETPDSVAAKIKALKSNGDQEKFLADIEQLTTKLTALYVKNKIPIDVATKMATKTGVESLISKATDTESRIILKAAEFSSIQEAIQKYNETSTTPTAQIFNTRMRKVNSDRGNFSRGNQNNRFNYRNSANNRQFQPRYFTAQRENNQRYNNTPRYDNRPNNGNYRGRQGYRGHPFQGRQAHGIYFADAQNAVPATNAVFVQHPHVMMPPNMPHDTNQPHVQPHPLGGTQGQYSQ